MNKTLPILDGESMLMSHQFIDSYYKSLSFFSLQLFWDKDSAEDRAQNAFLNDYKQRAALSSEDKVVKSYLYSTVKFRVLNHIQHHKVIENYSLQAAAADPQGALYPQAENLRNNEGKIDSHSRWFVTSKSFRKGTDQHWPILQSEVNINPELK